VRANVVPISTMYPPARPLWMCQRIRSVQEQHGELRSEQFETLKTVVPHRFPLIEYAR
jgi:hypothetical protein